MGKQDRAYSSNRERLEKSGLVQRVCGTNSACNSFGSMLGRGRAPVWELFVMRGKVSLFRPVLMACMFQEIIFSKVEPFRLLLGFTYSYMGLKMQREGRLCLKWVVCRCAFDCSLSFSSFAHFLLSPYLRNTFIHCYQFFVEEWVDIPLLRGASSMLIKHFWCI